AGDQNYPSVAALSDGSFVVVWTSWTEDRGHAGVYGQRYSAPGAPVGGEFRVNSFRHGTQALPCVAGLSDGGFVVAWTSRYQDGNGSGIYGQRYSHNTPVDPVGGEFRVNTYTASDQDESSVTGLSNGEFVVVWQSWNQDGVAGGIYGQRFSK